MFFIAIGISKTCSRSSALLNCIRSRLIKLVDHECNHTHLKCRPSLSHNISFKFYSTYPPDEEIEPPGKKIKRIVKSDMKLMVDILDGNIQEHELAGYPHFFPNHCDILIIGGGVIGSSIAYWMQQRALNGLSIIVLEKDSSVINPYSDIVKYANCSTTLSAGGLRQQFSLPENIEMSMFGAEFLRNINDYLGIEGQEPPDVQFTPQGYLFLATEKSAHILEENSKLQRSLGAKNELLTRKKLKEKFPWMNSDDIVLGCHGLENEGWFDPWSLLMAFKKKAMHLGTKFITAELESFKFENQPEIVMDNAPLGQYEGIRAARVKLPNGERKSIAFSQLIIATGSHSGEVGKLAKIGTGQGYLGIPIPVEPRKRYVYCFHCPEGPGLKAPFVIDPSGMYFRREGLGDNYICGRSPDPDDEPSCDNFEVDYKFFEEKVWPFLAHRVPAFEKLKVKSGWAGYYDFNTFDENALIGPHPGYINVYIATGFSGHGLQQAPAVGRAIMELIIDGRYATIDLSRMQYERIYHDEFLLETNIV